MFKIKKLFVNIYHSKGIETLYFFFLFSTFFAYRHIFLGQFSYITGQYSDFTSFSSYLSDIIILSLLFFIIARRIKLVVPHPKIVTALVSWLFLVSLFHVQHETIQWYYFARMIECLFVYLLIYNLHLNKPKLHVFFAKLFIFFSTAEALISIIQFLTQRSIGLKYMGESALSGIIPGVAKISLKNGLFMRGYGTFPHPNLLSAFLVTGILLNLYLLITNSGGRKQRYLYTISFILLIFGLFTTFSRSGLISLGCSLVIFFALFVNYTDGGIRKCVKSLILTLFTIFTAIILFSPFLTARLPMTSDAGSADRLTYIQAGLHMIKDKPILGLGLGESMLHMKQYAKKALKPWQIQPIHNYFLLFADEAGIIGLILIIYFFWLHMKQLFNSIIKRKAGDSPFKITLLAIFLGFMVLMQFDHYFYTLWQTQVLLWMILGIMAACVAHETSPD